MSGSKSGALHRHGHRVHSHPYGGSHRHLALLRRSKLLTAEAGRHDHSHGHSHHHGEHGHSHGLIDRSILRSREGVKTVAISLAVLGLTAGAQLAVFVLSGSVALLADLIHNFGDANSESDHGGTGDNSERDEPIHACMFAIGDEGWRAEALAAS